MQKQKRDKRGRYGYKTYYLERVGQCLLLAGSIWAVNVIEFRNLEPVKIVISGSSDPLIATQDAPEQVFESDVVSLVSSQPKTIEAKIRAAFPEDPDRAIAIFRSESGLDPNAKGDIPLEYKYKGKIIGHSCGIAQIRVLPGRPDCETLKDVDENLKFARHLYEKQGWYPWSNFKNGKYLSFMN